MIPLIPLLRLMHLRISGSCTVFRGTGSRNDGSIHNRTAMHQQAGFLKAIPDVSKNLLSDVVFLKQMAELQQGCRIRNLFRHKIYAKKTTHGVAVIYGVLCPFVGQVEPCLHQIHPQHCLDTPNRSPMLSLRIVRSDHFYPCFPRDDLFHLVEKFLPLRRLFPVSVFNIRQCYLIFHTAHLPCFAFLYYTTF